MKRVVYLATDEELSNPVYLLRLWLAARNMSKSRRKWLDVLCDGIYGFDGEIKDKYGMRWQPPDDYIDSVMGDPRWISYWLEESQGRPRREVRMIERLRTFDLWFRIAKPEISAHFGR